MSTAEFSKSSNVGQFALCIEGLPSSYTWQDVKDLARNRAEHGIRADVAFRTGPNGETTAVHVAKVTRRNEANNLYEWLVANLIEQRQLRVHFFEGSTCLKSNCSLSPTPCGFCRPRQATQQASSSSQAHGAPIAYSVAPNYGYNVAPAGMSRAYPAQGHTTGYIPTTVLAPPPPPSVSSGPVDYQQAARALRARAAAGNALNATQEEFLRQMASLNIDATPSSQYPGNNGQVLAAAASGAPINTAYGFARTEVRGVFVSGLNFNIRAQDLIDLFSKAGTVRRCQLHTDSRGNGKGTATIEFATSSEASQAVQALNNFPWKGRTLRVRNDREAVVVSTPSASASSYAARRTVSASEDSGEPTIVDGSSSRQMRRDSKVTGS